MGEADVRVAAGVVVTALREAGRSEGTIRRYQAVLDRFAAFLAGRGLRTASDQACADFIAGQTGTRLGTLREPVADRNHGRRLPQAACIRAMSPSVKMNGAGRLPYPGNTPLGGISVAGSMVRSQAASPRTAVSRWVHVHGVTPCGSCAHAIACSAVMTEAPCCWR